jgi:hypothetical protein
MKTDRIRFTDFVIENAKLTEPINGDSILLRILAITMTVSQIFILIAILENDSKSREIKAQL